MSFTFTEDQKLLSESADRFVLDDYNFETRRKIIGQDGAAVEKGLIPLQPKPYNYKSSKRHCLR